MSGVRREPAHFEYVLQVCHRLKVAGVVPSKIFVLFNECSHGSHPLRSLEALESTLQGLFNFWKSFVVTLQGIAAGAHRAGNLAQSSAGNATAGRCVVTGAGHLSGIRQATGDCFSFFNLHLILSVAVRPGITPPHLVY